MMTDYDLDALLAASLVDQPRLPDAAFVDHSRKRVALQAIIARETRAAIRRGVRDLALAVALIAMLIAWSGLIADSYGVAAIILPLLVVAFWSIAHDWSFPNFSFHIGDGTADSVQPVRSEQAKGAHRTNEGLSRER